MLHTLIGRYVFSRVMFYRKLILNSKLSLLISFVSFCLIYIGLESAVDFLGLPTYIDFGETINVTRGSGRYSYDEDISGVNTDIGIYIMVMSGMFAWRVYHWLKTGKLDGNRSTLSLLSWTYWVVGFSAYIVATTPIWFIDMPGIIQRLLALGLGGGIAWFTFCKYNQARDEIEYGEKNT